MSPAHDALELVVQRQKTGPLIDRQQSCGHLDSLPLIRNKAELAPLDYMKRCDKINDDNQKLGSIQRQLVNSNAKRRMLGESGPMTRKLESPMLALKPNRKPFVPSGAVSHLPEPHQSPLGRAGRRQSTHLQSNYFSTSIDQHGNIHEKRDQRFFDINQYEKNFFKIRHLSG